MLLFGVIDSLEFSNDEYPRSCNTQDQNCQNCFEDIDSKVQIVVGHIFERCVDMVSDIGGGDRGSPVIKCFNRRVMTRHLITVKPQNFIGVGLDNTEVLEHVDSRYSKVRENWNK